VPAGAAPFGGEAAAERFAQLAVSGAVGGQECRDAALAHRLDHAALQERAPEPAELPRTGPQAGPGSHGAAIEVDHDRLGAGARLAQQQILHVQVRVAATRVVEAAYGRTDRRTTVAIADHPSGTCHFDAYRTSIRPLKRLSTGSIISITSIEGVRAAPGYAAYAAAKAGVINYTKTAALELAPHGIRVNALAPDITLTEGLEAVAPPGSQARFGHVVPMGRAGHVDEMAGAAVFLASNLASYITGQTLHVDGGTHAAGGWYHHPHTGVYSLGPTD